VIVVDADVPAKGPITIQADHRWTLQAGDRAAAYAVMHQRMLDYVRDQHIQRVVIKASALSMGSTKMGHLASCEVRGVVISAAASLAPTRLIAKALISRTFGSRKADEYLRDDAFWGQETNGAALRVGSREAALVLLAARK
jgi:hypothetical protein